MTFLSRGSSVAHLRDLALEGTDAGGEGHVHELTLGVHLEASDDGGVDLVLDGECLAGVGGVSLEGFKHLAFLGTAEGLGRDNGDLLLLVEGSVVSSVLVGDFLDEVKTLVFDKDFHESEGSGVEGGSLKEGSVKLFDFMLSNTLVIGEHSEVFRVLMEVSNVRHVLVDGVEGFSLRSSSEEDGSVSTLNHTGLLDGALVSLDRVDNGDVTSRPGLEERLIKLVVDGLSRFLGFGLVNNGGSTLNSGLLFLGDSGFTLLLLCLLSLFGEVSEGHSLSSEHTVLGNGDVTCHHVSESSGEIGRAHV